MSRDYWRVGEHYGIHVYEVVEDGDDVPVATFHNPDHARLAVEAVNWLLGDSQPEPPPTAARGFFADNPQAPMINDMETD